MTSSICDSCNGIVLDKGFLNLYDMFNLLGKIQKVLRNLEKPKYFES